MKKILSFLTALTLVFGAGSALPEGALKLDTDISASAETYGDYEYTVFDKDDTVSITKYNGTDTKVTIPSTIDGKKVTSIGYRAFSWCTSLKSITIPDSVTSIDAWAFSDCTSLTSVTIPNSVTSIGNGAFNACTSLTSVTIPNSVTSVGERAFFGCAGLTSITIPDSVTSIGKGAFRACTSLTSITIPDSLTSIGGWAFVDCTSLTSITIPKSVTSIDDEEFGYYYDKETIAYKSLNDFTIYGYSGTAAEEYANKNGFTFIPLDAEPGDADGNGDVTVDDVLLIQQKIAGWDVKIDMAAADLDGDGKLSVSDALIVQQIIAGWKIGG